MRWLIENLFWKYHKSEEVLQDFTKEEVDVILSSHGKDEQLPEILKGLLKGDRERYFRAVDERTRIQIKGGYVRTLMLLRKIQAKNDEKNGKVVKAKVAGRYAEGI